MELSEESYLVGRAREKNDIIKSITSASSDPVVFLWGVRGIGKTTLVRDVYDSQEVRDTFHRRAYVTIVRPFNSDELFKSIVMQLTTGRAYEDKYIVDSFCRRSKTMTREQLMDALDTLLNGMRCLIVLDDVLFVKEWLVISRPFCRGRNSNKIVATTRDEGIAYACSDITGRSMYDTMQLQKTVYELKPLGYEDALDLFRRKVIKKHNDTPSVSSDIYTKHRNTSPIFAKFLFPSIGW
jgi:predicted AAA+ superfamily ATPase